MEFHQLEEQVFKTQLELLDYFKTHYPKIYQGGLRSIEYKNRLNNVLENGWV